MDRRTDLDDAAFFKQYAEARERGISISPAPELMHRASDAMAARAALGLSREDHGRLVSAEADAARMALIADEFRRLNPDDPNAGVLERAAAALGDLVGRLRSGREAA